MTLRPAPILEPLRAQAFDRWREHSGFSARRMEDTYQRWLRGVPADRCHFGKEQGLALDCRCLGCLQVLTFLYLDQVHAKLAMPLSRHTHT